MQIYELTSGKRNLKEYDPSRSPPGTPNYATGVGPGVKPQMTATPTVSGDSTVAAATGNTVNKADPTNPNIAAQTPYVQGRSGQGSNPTRFAKYDPSTSSMANLGQGMQAMTAPAPTPAATSAPAATPTLAPGLASAPGPAPANVTTSPAASTVPTGQTPADIRKTKQAAAAKIAQDQMAPFSKLPAPAPETPVAGINPELAAAGKVKMGAPQGRKANIGGAIANAMQAYNANKVGLGYLLPKDAKNEVYTDSTGKITIDGVPYDAANPEHQRLVGKITIGGKPYNGANPEHRAAYLAFKNTAGRGGRDTVKIDANGKVTVLGQPFDPSNPAHVQEYRRHVLGSSVAQTPPPAPPPQQPAAQQPAAQQSSDVEQGLISLGYSPQQAAAMAAKVPPGTDTQAAIKLGLAGKLNESLIWSRNFDPSRTLLKKIRQL